MNETESNYSAVVVTGAAGWLGQNLTRALLTGLPDCPALATSPFASLPLYLADNADMTEAGADEEEEEQEKNNARVQRRRTDITRADECYRLFQDVPAGALVLHCAGVIHPRRVADFDAVNRQGTVHIMEAAKAAQAARVVVVSSNSPCGCNRAPDERFNEESPYHPYMGYGRAKMQMEQFVRALPEDSHSPDWTIIRAPWFYGPLQPPRQSLFFQMIRNGKGPIVGGGENRRSMVYTDNLVQGLLRAALTPAAARQLYWIADAEPYTMNQIIDTIERLLEEDFSLSCQRRRLRLPGLAAEIAYCCDWILQFAGLYQQKIHVLSEMNKTIACDISKAQRELGYAPAIALEEGMRRSIADVLARGGRI